MITRRAELTSSQSSAKLLISQRAQRLAEATKESTASTVGERATSAWYCATFEMLVVMINEGKLRSRQPSRQSRNGTQSRAVAGSISVTRTRMARFVMLPSSLGWFRARLRHPLWCSRLKLLVSQSHGPSHAIPISRDDHEYGDVGAFQYWEDESGDISARWNNSVMDIR